MAQSINCLVRTFKGDQVIKALELCNDGKAPQGGDTMIFWQKCYLGGKGRRYGPKWVL